MGHDYGINPCCFTKGYDPMPQLMSIGDCNKVMEASVKKLWGRDIKNGTADVYLMAIAAHSSDENAKLPNKKKKDSSGKGYVTPHYKNLVYVAKVTDFVSMEEYLSREEFQARRDVFTYNRYFETGKWGLLEEQRTVLLSSQFRFFGAAAIPLNAALRQLFEPARGFKIYQKSKKPAETDLLRDYIDSVTDHQENRIDQPYYPIPVNREHLFGRNE
jgi:hypothetical protein